MRNYFIFNGVDSRDFGVYISGSGRVTIPEKAFEFIEIPGQHGDTLLNGAARVRNEVITYPAFISPYNDNGIPVDFSEMAGRLRAWLMSVKGYAELTDSYDPAHYRRACFTGPTDFEITRKLDAGSFEIAFNCRPQRYTNDDETYTLGVGDSMTFDKCGFFYSAPLISAEGAGSFSVGDQTVTIAQSALTYPIYIDSLLMDCYDSLGVNANLYVSFSDYEYPRIADGTTITATDMMIHVEPRWYEL